MFFSEGVVMKKLALSLLCTLSIFNGAHALDLSRDHARIAGGVTGVATAAVMGYVVKGTRYALPIALASGGAVGWLSYNYYFYTLTPEGRYEAASNLVRFAGANPISETSFESDMALFDVLEDLYIGEEWYLVSAFNDLSDLLEGCRDALDLLDRARLQAKDNLQLAQDCKELSKIVRGYILNLTNANKRIRNHENYTVQMKAFKQEQIEREKLAVERDKANAAHSQAAATWHMAKN